MIMIHKHVDEMDGQWTLNRETRRREKEEESSNHLLIVIKTLMMQGDANG